MLNTQKLLCEEGVSVFTRQLNEVKDVSTNLTVEAGGMGERPCEDITKRGREISD